MSRLSPGTRVIAVALAVLGTIVISIGLGGGALPVVLVAVVLLVASQRRLFASIPGRERSPLLRATIQTWWAPVASGLGLLTLLAGIGNIFAATNTSGRIIGSTLLIACGAGMFYGLVRRPFARAAGNTLILVTTIPAGLVFWLIVPTVLALVVWVGVISSGFEDHRVATAAS